MKKLTYILLFAFLLYFVWEFVKTQNEKLIKEKTKAIQDKENISFMFSAIEDKSKKLNTNIENISNQIENQNYQLIDLVLSENSVTFSNEEFSI